MTKDKEMITATAEKTITLFEKFWNITKEAAKDLKKPLVERSARRKFQAAYDSCEEKIIEAETKMNKLFEDIENLNINDLLAQRQIKINAEKTKLEISNLNAEFFGDKIAA